MLVTFVIFSLVFLLILLLSFVYMYQSYGKRPTTIPGPEMSDPKSGNLGDMKKAGGLHDYVTQLHKKYGPIVSFWMETDMVVSIASPELFKENSMVFDRPAMLFDYLEPLIGKTSIQFANGAEGKRRRTLYDKKFSHASCMKYLQEFRKMSEELAAKWTQTPPEEHIPLHKVMMALAVKGITRTCFGNFFNDDENIYDFTQLYDVAMTEMNERLSGQVVDPTGKREQEFHEALDDFKSVIKKIIKFREVNGPETPDEANFLDVLMDSTTDEDIMVSDAISFVVGGFHTSGNFLTWIFYFLGHYPDIQEKVYQELKKVLGDEPFTLEKMNEFVYTQQVLDETLRWAMIGPYAARVQDTEIKLGGHVIPSNTPVIHALGVVLRDENHWPEPEKFDPERFSEEASKKRPKLAFPPFGFAGKRKCPGYRFSYIEATVVLSIVIPKFVLRLVNSSPVVLSSGFVTKPLDEIWLTVEKREATN